MPLNEQGGLERMIPVHTSTQEVPLPFKGSFPLAGRNKASIWPYVNRLLLFCIFSIIFRQTVLVRQRVTTVDFSAVDTYAYWDIVAVCLAALVLIFSGSLFRTWSALRRTTAVWLIVYYLVCAASFIWSLAPAYSLYRSIEYLVLFFATYTVVAQYQDFAEAERAFLRVVAATILLEMCVNLRLAGFSLLSLQAWHANTYSASSAILFCYCLGEYLAMTKSERSEAKKRSRRLRLFGIFSFGTLALGTSATSNVAVAVGCCLIFLALRRFGLLLAALFVGLLLAILGGGEELVRHLLFPGKTEKEIETAHGRTLIWKLYWHKFLQSPILGYGFGIISGGRDKALAALSHNSLFTVLIGTGSVGLMMFGLFAARLWQSTLGKIWRRGPGMVGFVGALAATFVNSMGIPLLADRWLTSSVVFVWLLGLFFIHVLNPQQVNRSSKRILPGKVIPGRRN
jgi:O-antigen ligase